LSSQEKIGHLVASRIGERFRVETSEGLMDLDFPIGDLAHPANELIGDRVVRNHVRN